MISQKLSPKLLMWVEECALVLKMVDKSNFWSDIRLSLYVDVLLT